MAICQDRQAVWQFNPKYLTPTSVNLIKQELSWNVLDLHQKQPLKKGTL